ncbi:MAG: hypothetical protein IJU78_01455 [Clostridia bacterium]|nr:hypothetical protein [Clostridia bacterium]
MKKAINKIIIALVLVVVITDSGTVSSFAADSALELTDFINNTSNGHAVVLRGYYVYQNISEVGIISYMDPATGNYVASSVATDGDFYYVPSGSSIQYTMNGFLAVS